MGEEAKQSSKLKRVIFVSALGVGAVIVACLVQYGRANSEIQSKLDSVSIGDAREEVTESLGSPNSISRLGMWPEKDPPPTNVVYAHHGPAPSEVWGYKVGRRNVEVHFGPKDWITSPDTWRVTHTLVTNKRNPNKRLEHIGTNAPNPQPSRWV